MAWPRLVPTKMHPTRLAVLGLVIVWLVFAFIFWVTEDEPLYDDCADAARQVLATYVAEGKIESIAFGDLSWGCTSLMDLTRTMERTSFGPDWSEEIAGIARVIDGNTLEIDGQRIRLHGIDAFERGQLCWYADRSRYDCGQRSAERLGRLVGGDVISCRSIPDRTDRYGRRLAVCFDAAGQDISEAMIRQGYALAYWRFSEDYAEAEGVAANDLAGVWAGDFEPPWRWRADR